MLLVGAFAPLAAGAAALQISPIRLDLLPGQSAAALTLRNRGTQPINAQVRVFRWTQDTDGDRLEPAPALVASPPIVQIPGRASSSCAWSSRSRPPETASRLTASSSTNCPSVARLPRRA
ncbi:fimbria/pilus periplasmic chaperone [Ralstonia syzygii subsp. celebesensis]|uniref:fimbria/pilus periplasmic chaperone n=1 Tax=Ralstonia syzygii TaxID=28097 RepID=UPI00387E0A39